MKNMAHRVRPASKPDEAAQALLFVVGLFAIILAVVLLGPAA